jgi:hypothetical protein
MGIKKTLKAKRKIVGYGPLSDTSITKLKFLIERLRKIYVDENRR